MLLSDAVPQASTYSLNAAHFAAGIYMAMIVYSDGSQEKVKLQRN